MKIYKALLKFIQIAVVAVVLPRVASFVGLLGYNNPGFDIHDLIRFAFAITLGLGTVATAYFSDDTEAPEYDDEPTNSRERKRREREAVYFATMQSAAPYARRAMLIFAFLDGAFNLADAFFGAVESGLLDPVHGPFLVGVWGSATFFFGVTPTILSIFLAKLISMVDRIPEDYERPITRRQMDILRTVMGNLGLREYKAGDAAQLMANSVQALPSGDQSQRVKDFLDTFATLDDVPSINQIREAMGEPVPARSTISLARQEWLRERRINYDPFRGH